MNKNDKLRLCSPTTLEAETEYIRAGKVCNCDGYNI